MATVTCIVLKTFHELQCGGFYGPYEANATVQVEVPQSVVDKLTTAGLLATYLQVV